MDSTPTILLFQFDYLSLSANWRRQESRLVPPFTQLPRKLLSSSCPVTTLPHTEDKLCALRCFGVNDYICGKNHCGEGVTCVGTLWNPPKNLGICQLLGLWKRLYVDATPPSKLPLAFNFEAVLVILFSKPSQRIFSIPLIHFLLPHLQESPPSRKVQPKWQ